MTTEPHTYTYTDDDGDTLRIAPVPDASTYQGTARVVAVQTEGGTADGGPPQTVYVHRDHVDRLITAIREAAAVLDCLPD